MRRALVLITLLLLLGAGLAEWALREEDPLAADLEPFPFDEPHAALSPGQNDVSAALSRVYFLGMESAREFECSGRTADPGVEGIRLELFRVEPGGPRLVARTPVVPGGQAVFFRHDVLDDPIGTQFLLRGTFYHPDGQASVEEKTVTVEEELRFD